jgi:hypothetical protein
LGGLEEGGAEDEEDDHGEAGERDGDMRIFCHGQLLCLSAKQLGNKADLLLSSLLPFQLTNIATAYMCQLASGVADHHQKLKKESRMIDEMNSRKFLELCMRKLDSCSEISHH